MSFPQRIVLNGIVYESVGKEGSSPPNNTQSSKNIHFDLANLVYFTILLVILYLMITGWDALIDRMLEKWVGWDPNSIPALVLYAFIFTLISIIFLWVLDEDFGYIFGIESGGAAAIGGGIPVMLK